MSIPDDETLEPTLPTAVSLAQKGFQSIKLPKNPTAPAKGLGVVALQHDVPLFPTHLAEYITRIELQKAAKPRRYPIAARLLFSRINIYHSFRLGLEGLHDDTTEQDWVKASPVSGGRFDTVVVLVDDDADAVSLQGKLSHRDVPHQAHIPNQGRRLVVSMSFSPCRRRCWWVMSSSRCPRTGLMLAHLLMLPGSPNHPSPN